MICEETYAADTPGWRGLSACGGGDCVLRLRGGGAGGEAATFNNRRHKKVGEKRLFSCWLPVAIGPSGFLLIIIMIAINI